MFDENQLNELVDKLTLAEQVSLLSGEDVWSLPAIESQGLGKLRVTDGPNGARGGGSLVGGVTAAAFPVGISLGASWDPSLVGQVAAAIADEVKSKGAHTALAPTVNIHRSVTNGRNFECYSEDPELSAALATAYVSGLQAKGIAATIKHFVGNESEIERTTISSEIDERSLREVYLRPFEDAVKRANTWGIMSSYNKINGTYTAEHTWLLTQVLREEWGYDGIVMSDWFGSRTTAETINAGLDLEMPGPTRDRGDKLVQAVNDGQVEAKAVRSLALNVLRLMARTGAISDHREHVEIADDRPEHRALIRKAGAAGSVLLKNDGLLPFVETAGESWAVIGPNAKTAQIMGGGSAQLNPHYVVSPWDAMAARVGAGKVAFAPGVTHHRWEPLLHQAIEVEYFANRTLAGEPVHHETIDQSMAFWFPPIAGGNATMDNFSARIKTTYTPAASGDHCLGLHNAGLAKLYVDGTLVIDGWSTWKKGHTFFEEGNDELTKLLPMQQGQTYEIMVEFSCKTHSNLGVLAWRFGISKPLGDQDIALAVDTAKGADRALLFVGRNGEWDTEGSDLADMKLPGRQDELIERVLDVNPNTVVVLQTGGPVEMPWVHKAKAILQAWYPGQEAGNAIVDVLFGDQEPSGRLPQTFPAMHRDNPTHSQDAEIYPGLDGKVRYEEGVFIGYRHYERHGIDPLFCFGHGLGYSEFQVDGLDVHKAPEGVTVSATLTNVGQRQGASVLQLYVGDLEASVERPAKELKAFAKVDLAAGQSQRVEMLLTDRDFAFFDAADGCWRIEAGDFDLSLGLSVQDIRATAHVSMEAKHWAP